MPKQPVFGDILLAARREKGMTQEDLSRRSGVAARAISWLERGHGNPNLRTIMLLTAGLGAQLMLGFKLDGNEAAEAASGTDLHRSTRA